MEIQSRMRWSVFSLMVLLSVQSVFGVDPITERKLEEFASATERVEVIVAIPETTLATSIDTRDLQYQLLSQLKLQMGPAWQTTIQVQPLPRERFELTIDRITFFVKDAEQRSQIGAEQARKVDKTFIIVLSREKGGIGYQVLEYDWFLNEASDVVSGVSSLSAFRPSDLARAINACYRPIMKIIDGENNQFEALLKGGEYLLDADSRIQQGDYYAPVNFYYDRKGNLVNREFIPWTYLKIGNRERSDVDGEVISAYRNILGGQRRRVETYAYRRQANFKTSEMTFQRRDETKSALAGYLVKTSAIEPPQKDKKETRILEEEYTSRDGSLSLKADPKEPIVMINVISGDAVLVKVPFMVGSSPAVQLDVPNDLVRLGVEGELQTLETQLVDLVARRAVLMARARKAGKEKDMGALDEIEKDLKTFPNSRTLLREISVVKVNSVEEALKQRNRAAASKVEKLCASASELVEKHLSEKITLEILAEIGELKKSIKTES